ncbi:hypothetical protein Goklo_017362, partial [Gossypium klotzschianum]|nr:hypothetical protein [Gossypium klotzschianum]
IGYNSSCPVYGHEVEDIIHVLRDCFAAKEVWTQVVPSDQQFRFFSGNLYGWFMYNLSFHERLTGTLTGYWTHLFTKGAVARENGSASAGGVAELWGILDGLLVLLSKGFERATIQTDNIDVVKALQDNMMANLENNLVVDCLAKLSLALKASLQIFENAPNEVL